LISKASVSVIVPCFNGEECIARCIESITNQTVCINEVIFIDDCSSDDSLNVINSIFSSISDYRTTIIKNKMNLGVSISRNLGLNVASSDYIAFLDVDDVWLPEKIEVQYTWMIRHPNVFLTGHEMNNSRSSIQIEMSKVRIRKIHAKKALLSNPFSTPTIMMKNTKYYRFPNMRYAEDYAFWLEILFDSQECFKLSVVMASMFKPEYGSSGLSSELWLMEKGVQKIYLSLYKINKINLFEYIGLIGFSYVKYMKRVLISLVLVRSKL